MTEIMHLTRNGHILEMRLDRPKANAIDSSTSREMGKAFNAFRDDPELWVAILTGTGKFFSAGWDLKAAAAGTEGDGNDHGENGFGGIVNNYTLKKPVIAAVNGYAAGGGFEIALACDMIVASTNASFMLSEVNVGVMATGGGIIELPKRIPWGIANEMLYTGRPMNSSEALKYGLICRESDPNELMDSARALAEDIVTSAPLSVQAVKSILRDVEGLPRKEAFKAQERNPEHEKALKSEDFKEGPKAFSEKRKPRWQAK